MSNSKSVDPHKFNFNFNEAALDAVAKEKNYTFFVARDHLCKDNRMGKSYAAFLDVAEFEHIQGFLVHVRNMYLYEILHSKFWCHFAQNIDTFKGRLGEVLEANFQMVRRIFKEHLGIEITREMACISNSVISEGDVGLEEDMPKPSVHIVWRIPGVKFLWKEDTMKIHDLYVVRLYKLKDKEEEAWASLLLGPKVWSKKTFDRYPISDPLIHSDKVLFFFVLLFDCPTEGNANALASKDVEERGDRKATCEEAPQIGAMDIIP